ncbi:hypothetical protein M9Y10_010506 [Tritrichomonas musculus]|uniref:Uncharacterized protein n=1 Tax=Tritrichomonas musculus TaxID=1915356 RepID=A0ABR2IL20_9EUKA
MLSYKPDDQIDKSEFERKNETRTIQDDIPQVNKDIYQVFFLDSISVESFLELEEEDQIYYLEYISYSIEQSLERQETQYALFLCIQSGIPQFIQEIMEKAESIQVLECCLELIDQWIRCFSTIQPKKGDEPNYLEGDSNKYSVDVWIQGDLPCYLFFYATSSSEKMTSTIFQQSISILIRLFNKKKDQLKIFFSLKKIIIRIVDAFKINRFPNTMKYLSDFLDTIFINIQDFDENDVFPLIDIFVKLPGLTDFTFFPELMSCAINIFQKSRNFTQMFIENVDFAKICSQLSNLPSSSLQSIVSMMFFFLDTRDQMIIQSFMSKFQWSWILPVMQSPDEKIDRNVIALLSVKIIVTFPDSANHPDVKNLIEHFCYMIHHNKYVNRLTVLKYISDLFSIHNSNVTELLINNSYIEIASDYLNSANGDAIVCIINSLHHIAQYAEVRAIPQILERMAQADIFFEIAELAHSEEQNISLAARAFLNDQNLSGIQQYLPH